jgi:hypothetical protein
MPYTAHASITVPAAHIPSSQTDFPLLFSGTYTYLKTLANGGNVTSSNGYDIIFTSDSAGTIPLDFEKINYDPGSGTVEFRVRVQMTASTDCVLYVWFGNSSITSYQGNNSGTWASAYRAVYHLGDGTTLSTADSTGNTNTLTVQHGAVAATGQPYLSGGVSAPADPDCMSFVNTTSVRVQTPFTIRAWVYLTSYHFGVIFTLFDGLGNYNYQLGSNSGAPFFLWRNGSFTPFLNDPSTIPLNTWTQITVRVTGITAVKFWVNNVNTSNQSSVISVPAMSTGGTGFLAGDNGTSGIHGVVDEVMLYNGSMSDDLESMLYLNELSPITFYSVSLILINILEGSFDCDGTTSISTIAYAKWAGNVPISGTTDVALTPNINWTGNVHVDSATTLSFVPFRQFSVFINADGSTSLFCTPNQTQYGTVIFDQIDQEMSALLSFVLGGSSHFFADTTVNLNARSIILGPDYIFGLIQNVRDVGSPNFIPIGNDSFTLASKTAISIGTGPLGALNYRYALGFSRPASAYYNKQLQRFTRQEYVRFNLFVDQALDFVQMSDTLGFTADSKAAIAGYGLLGRDKEEYVTFSVLTNVHNTQTNLELLSTGNPNVDVTQVVYEMLWKPSSSVNATQAVAEVLYLANLASIQQLAVEAITGTSIRNTLLDQVAVEVLQSIISKAVVTQVVTEVLRTNNSVMNVTQVTAEVLTRIQNGYFAQGVVQQVAIEQLAGGLSNTFVNSVVVEIMNSGLNPPLRVNGEVIETLHNNQRNGVIQQVALEVVNNSTTRAAVVNQVAIEMLIRMAYDPEVASLVNNPKFHT